MTEKKNTTYLILFIFNIITSSMLCSQTVDSSFVDGRLYIKVNTSSTMDLANYNFTDPTLNQILSDYSVTDMVKAFKTAGPAMSKVYRIEFSAISQAANLISAMQGLSYIEYAEKAPIYHINYNPNDYSSGQQYALGRINAPQAWDIEKGSSNVVVAIVDNGVNINHEDILPNRWVNTGETPGNGLDDDLNGYTDDIYGYDVADGDNDPIPPSGGPAAFVHGSHCAGIASAKTDNGVGIASIGYSVSLMSVKATPNSSDGNTLPNAYEGVDYALRAGADIVSMSFGSSSGFLTWEVIINQAQTMGVLLIAAAGNDNSSATFFPAGYPYVFSVGATDANDVKASFSNYGNTIDAMAPGVAIKSTFFQTNSSYGQLSGTSMSCPMVAGLAGLLLSYDSSFSIAQLKNFLKNGCDNIDSQNPTYVGQIGSGRINAFKSLQLASGLTIGEINNDTFTFDLFPNPNNGVFTIRPHQTLPFGTIISFYDLSGKKVKENEYGITFADENMTVDARKLSPGTYLMNFAQGDYQEIRRIVIH
jgi:serine protease